ncbi:MAG: hypothetical protein IPP83_15725 [Flavobacteriales bacterium]|nr:hypothetical protein [Flavobacteriales bacterium]
MWLHGLGFLLPRNMTMVVATVWRHHHCLQAEWLEPTIDPPIYLGTDRCFRSATLGPVAQPIGRMPPAKHMVARELPPTGTQLWSGHHMEFRLCCPWPSTFRPPAAQWPMDLWSPYLRTWHLHRCPKENIRWQPTPWYPACPALFTAVEAHYHRRYQQAEWVFRLVER